MTRMLVGGPRRARWFQIALLTLVFSHFAIPAVTAQGIEAPVAAQLFRFNTEDQSSYRLVSTNTQTIFLNGVRVRDAEIVTRVQINPRDPDGAVGVYDAVFTLTENSRQRGEPVRVVGDAIEVSYRRDRRGNMEIDPDFIMPVVRDFPVFPEEAVEPGDSWSSPAREVHDLMAGYNIREPLRFDFRVFYTYRGAEIWRGRAVHAIEAEYDIIHREQRDAMVYPELVVGESRQTLYWDAQAGRLAGSEEDYFIEFHLSDGRTIGYQGQADMEVLEAQPLDRAVVIADIQRRLAEAGIESDTRVTDDQGGVVLVLERIGFPPDSAVLLPEEQARLGRIAEILAEYPENDILISGHTALAGTAAGRERLSFDRARAVGEYLLENQARPPEQILYRGLGASEPIADNATEDGRRRNRRVEIMILDN